MTSLFFIVSAYISIFKVSYGDFINQPSTSLRVTTKHKAWPKSSYHWYQIHSFVSSITSLNELRKRSIFHQMFWHYFKAGHFAGCGYSRADCYNVKYRAKTWDKARTRCVSPVSAHLCQVVSHFKNLQKHCPYFMACGIVLSLWTLMITLTRPQALLACCLVTCYVKGCCDPGWRVLIPRLRSEPHYHAPTRGPYQLTTSWSRWPGPHSSCYFLP